MARHRNGIEHDLAEQLTEPVTDERKITGEALVSNDRERPKSERPSISSVPRACSGLMYSGVPTRRPALVRLVTAHSLVHFATPKSKESLAVSPSSSCYEEDVLRLEIAVHHAERVRPASAREKRARSNVVFVVVEPSLGSSRAASDSPRRYSMAMKGVRFQVRGRRRARRWGLELALDPGLPFEARQGSGW